MKRAVLATGLCLVGAAGGVRGVVQDPAARFVETAVIPSFRQLDPLLDTFETCLRQAVDDDHLLLIVRASRQAGERCAGARWHRDRRDAFGVFLMDRARADRVWLLAMLPQPADDGSLRVERADASSLVLWEGDDGYGFGRGRVKLFIDAPTRRLVDRVEYGIDVGMSDIVRADDRLCATFRRTRTAGVLACASGGRFAIESTVALGPPSTDPATAPPELPPLPQSTWDEFAAVRPDRVANGYRRDVTVIEERAGPWQRVGDRIWFGRTFYDGEGTTGVGAIGRFDLASRSFSFISPEALRPWSASALLIEDDVAWVGLVRHPEGADYGHGLLRVHLTDRNTGLTPIADMITGIVRWRGALYVATTNGVYVVDGRALRRYRLEPSGRGGMEILAETLPSG